MADAFRFPFIRHVNYLGAYRVNFGKNALPVLEDMQFEATFYDLTAGDIAAGAPFAGLPVLTAAARPAAGSGGGSARRSLALLAQARKRVKVAFTAKAISAGAPFAGAPALSETYDDAAMAEELMLLMAA